MVTDQILSLLRERGFQPINVNVNKIFLYYMASEGRASVVMVFDCPFGTEFTEGQYRNIKRQVYQNFMNQNYSSVKILSILCTAHVDTVKSICGNEDSQWFVDTVHSKLILYENQSSDFQGLRKDMEGVLLKDFKEQSENQVYRDNPYQGNNMDGYKTNASRNGKRVKYFSKYNTIIILMNVLVFVFTLGGAARSTYGSVDMGALYWPAVLYNHEYYRVFTYMFLHAGIEHIANNMLVLFVIGDNLERAVGKWKFLVIYFGTGILAGITSMSYNMLKQMNTVSVGASGAIFGVVGAMVYIVAVNKGRLENISTRQMVVFVLFSLYGGLTSQGVDNAAHIGGLVSGIVLAAIFYRKPRITYQERG